MSYEPAPEEIEALHSRLKREAEQGGYSLHPDKAFTRGLVRGLLVNLQRYGYMSCPCRIASGDREEDLDIVCPCDYRDPDLTEHGACYCALYVSTEIAQGLREARSIPERRPPREKRAGKGPAGPGRPSSTLSYPVWRCRVCGYLCARGDPPDICPVCKAKKDRFERFM